MKPLRVLLVDDQALVRRGLRRLLELEDAIEVMGEAANGVEALALLKDGDGDVPDVALVDARMPVMDGVTLIRELRRAHPEVATLLLTTFDDDDLIFDSLAAGAGGYLLKDVEPEDLVQAIRSVHRHTVVFAPPVVDRLVAHLQAARMPSPDQGVTADGEDPTTGLPPVLPGSPALTQRETEVVRLVATGASNRQIATTLFLNEGTVKNHVSAALRKLGLRDRTQLALAVRSRRPET